MNNERIKKAIEFCKNGHNAIGQVRKYTGEPYWVHPLEVMGIVKQVPHTENMLIACLFHDLVEDTKVTLQEIENEFGNEVAVLVEMLTDISKPTDGNRKTRKLKDLQHTAQASPEAKTIKLADLISNTKSITAHDKDFAKVYLREKVMLLEVLKEGDPTLYERANTLVHEYFKNNK